ncbi:MAG: PIN domain-containing protein [Nitrospirota bacterium]
MIILDTGPIVAFFDKDDALHSRSLETLKKVDEPLITTWPVITEAFYLLNFSNQVQDDLWEFIERGGVIIHLLEIKLYKRCRELMKKYYDLPMDLADATLVALGEEAGLSKVFTFDHKDFEIYRPKHRKRFSLIPERV